MMPARIPSLTGGVLRSSAAGAVAVLLAVAGLMVQAPELVLAAGRGCVTPGSAGPNATLTGIVNSYYPASASAGAGATAISVGAPIATGSPTAIAAGDQLLVIQMQDADIQGTNAVTYGDGATGRGSSGLRSTGLYEYVLATSAVVAGTVNIAGSGGGGGLVNNYDFSATVIATHGFRTFQVVRVPQFSSATVTPGLTAAAWDGTAHAGGILAIDVAGALNLNGQTISVNQLGFKGGLGVAQPGGPDANTDYAVASGRGDHGYKAEGIAGTPHFLYDAIANAAVNSGADGYPLGDAARGAPGNAGGGGTDFNPVANDQNSGGGGGANGGQGGTGGNSWNTNQPVGGLGGAAFPLVAATKVVLGGGGGSGSRNNSAGFASSGGTGGGIVMIRTGSLTGAGTITANGGIGVTPANDGGGGGGAGGSVVVSASTGTVNGLTVAANGGNGTDAWPGGPAGTANRHGPGGGGSGGVIITSNALPPAQANVLGGVHGITTNGAADAYGSTSGAAGIVQTTTAGAIPGSSSGAECLPVLTVAKSTSTPNVTNTVSGTVATYSITVSNAANTAPATNVGISDALPAGFTYATTLGVLLNGGATRPATVNPTLGDTNPTFGTFAIPASASVVINFTVNIASSVAPGTYSNPATATYLDPVRTASAGTTSVTYPGGGPERVSVGLSDMTIAKSHTDPFVRGSTTATYVLTATNSGGGASAGTVTLSDTLPGGLTPTAAVGTGWTCPAPVGQTVTCTRADALAAGSSYPPVRVTVTVLLTAANSVTNQATVSGGGETNTANDTASDPTNIISLAGLPNTSGLLVGADMAGPVAPDTSPGTWLIALGLMAGAAGLGIATLARRGDRARFRRRRRRPAFGAMPALLGIGVCALAVSQLVPNPTTTSISPPAAAAAQAPIAGELGARSVLIGATVVTYTKPAAPLEMSFHAALGPITPSRLRIPSIAVDAPVSGVGLLQDGSMGVPNNLWISGWLSSSVRPGQAGTAVFAGHRGIGTPALFSHLENVRSGDKIHVSDAGGGELVYEVTRVASLDLSVATQLQVFGPTTQRQLVLITCFGKYSRSTQTYDHRLVVFSRLVPAT